MLDVQIIVPESAPALLQAIFAGVSESYTICFHSINPSLLFQNLCSLKAQRMFFSQNYSKTIHLKKYSNKYASNCNAIFQSADVPSSFPFLSTFFYFLLHIKTVVMYLSAFHNFEHNSLAPMEINAPILKLVIYPERLANKDNLNVLFLCNNYCKEHSETLQTNIILKAIHDPVGTHKFHFWNSNKKVLPASVFARFWFYFEPEAYGNDRYACSRLVMKSINMSYYTYEVMATITLSEIHNISILPYSQAKTFETRLIEESMKGQYVLTAVRYIDYEYLPYFKLSGFQISTYDDKKAAYCKVTGEHRGYIDSSTWLSPFRFEIWLITLILLLVLPISFCSPYKINLIKTLIGNVLYDSVDLIGVFVRVSVPIHVTKRHVYIVASLVGLFTCGIYENFILSGVVQSAEPTKYSSLGSILSDGYKIIWFNKTSSIPPEKEFMSVFKLYRLNHLLNSSFYEIKSGMPNLKTKALFLAQNFVLFCDEISLPLKLADFEKRIKLDVENDARCFALPESIDPSPFFWEIYTVNRYWLIKSIIRMSESGLSDKWDHWANWAYQLNLKLFVKRDHISDTITLHKLLFPLLIYFLSCIIDTILFFCEFAQFHWMSVSLTVKKVLKFQNLKRVALVIFHVSDI